MSSFGPGQRVLASFQGGPWQPASVLEVNQYSGMLRVRSDDGRESWLAAMNVRVATNVPPAPVSLNTPGPAAAKPMPGAAPEAPPQPAPGAAPEAPPPMAMGDFHPIAPGNPADAMPPTVPSFSPAAPLGAATPTEASNAPPAPGNTPFAPFPGDKSGQG